MIAQTKTKLSRVLLAWVLCFGFTGSANGMEAMAAGSAKEVEKKEKHWKDTKKHYLLLASDFKCTRSFVTWEEGLLNRSIAADTGQSIFTLAPFARLEKSEKDKLHGAFHQVMLRAGKAECKLSYVDSRTCLGILLKVNRVLSDNDTSGYLVRYSQFFSSGDTPIFEIKEEGAPIVRSFAQSLSESTEQTADEFQQFMEDERESCTVL